MLRVSTTVTPDIYPNEEVRARLKAYSCSSIKALHPFVRSFTYRIVAVSMKEISRILQRVTLRSQTSNLKEKHIFLHLYLHAYASMDVAIRSICRCLDIRYGLSVTYKLKQYLMREEVRMRMFICEIVPIWPPLFSFVDLLLKRKANHERYCRLRRPSHYFVK